MDVARKLEDYQKRLTRRRNHLAKRVSTTTNHLSFDEAELATLDWVIAYLFDTQPQALDHLENYLRKGTE